MSDAPPRRAVTLKLDLQADTRDELTRALEQIVFLIDRGELTNGCSGGPFSGYSYEYSEAAYPTHEEYHAQLKEWIEAERRAQPQSPTHSGES